MTFRKISLAQWSRNLTKLNGVYPFTAKLSLTFASESFLAINAQPLEKVKLAAV
jgi:hypothetical protein